MEQLSLLQKIYLYGETLSSNELNQIVLYLNSSIEAINALIAKNNSINEGHCEMRFKVSTQLPNAPASGSDGTSDGWSDTYAMPNTANGECSWMTLSFFNGDGVYGSWSTPVCITWGSVPGLRGPKGESGVRGSFKSRVFKRLNSKPATPTGGTYDNPFPTSGGWHDGIPSGLAIIWSSVCTFYGNGLSSGWTEPAAESDTDTLDIEFSPSSVQPDPPIGSTPFANHESEGWYDPSSANFSNVGVMIWRAERKVSNGVYNGNWTITRIVGEKGAKGDSGDDGGHYKFRYCNFTPTPGHTTPTKPTQGSDGVGTFGSGANAATWAISVSDPNVNAGEYTYMTSCYVEGDEYGTWDDPIRITGGEGMAGEDGSNIEFIYTINNTGNIPDAPTASGLGNARIFTEDDWYGKDENGIIWTDNPTGISLENQYEYVAIREKPAGRGSSWSSYKVALWSKWGDKGQDGDGFEYIFLLSQEGDPSQIANPTPQNWSNLSSDYQTMNEYAAYLELHIPTGELYWWTDEPQSITSIYPYIYVSKRAKKLNGEGANATIPGVEATKMVWGPFSAPSLWCRYASLGSIGAHYEFRYCNFKPHTGQTKPTTPTTGSNGRGYFGSDSNTYGGYWGDSAADPDVEHKEYTYMTQCIFTPVEEGNDYYGEWSEPVRITGTNGEPGADGTDIEFIYCQYGPNAWSNPVAPTVNDDATIAMDDWPNVDGHTPSKTINGITWFDNPQGVNESNHKYEYMCQRIKPKGSLSWGPYNGPVIWSAYGEKGMDGDGYEYIFKHFERQQTWANSVTNTDAANNIQGGDDNPNNWSTSLSGFQNRDFYGPSGHTWSDDPQGISSTYLYEYVSTREYKLWPGETKKRWGTFSVPTLWANYALAGATVQGPPGDIGPMSYLAGVWDSSITYTKTSRLNPIVYYPANDSYYYLKNEGSSTGDNPAGTGMTYTEQHPNPWLQAENYNMVFTDILFVNQFAKLGSFIVNQDWMICQYGTIYDYGTGIHPILNTTDSIATGPETSYNYLNAYLLFDPAYPDKKKPNDWNFVPNYAINAVTGEIFCNNAHITGEVTATSGTFTGVVNASGGTFNGIVNATQFKAGDDNGFSITTSSDSLDFNYNGSRLAFFSLRGWDSTNNQLADVADNPTGFYLYLTNPLNGHLVTIDFANLSFKDLNENQVVRHEATFYRLSNLNGKAVETPVTLYYSLENNTTKWWLHSDSTTELTSSEMGTLYKKQQVNQRGTSYSTCVQEVDAGIPYVTTNYTLYELQTLQNNAPTKTGNYAMATHLNTNGSSSTDYWFVVPNSTTLLDSLNTNWNAVFRLSEGSVNSTTATTVIRSSNTSTVPTFNLAVSFINSIDENGNVVSILYPTPTLNF